MARRGYGTINRPLIKKNFGGTSVGQRIRRKMRRIGFGFKKGK